MYEPQSNVEEKVTPCILKSDFSAQTVPSIFTSIASALLGQLNQFFQHLNQQATSCPSPKCLVDQVQFQKTILVVATDQMPDHTYSRE